MKRNLATVIDEWAVKTPEALCYESPTQKVTYAELKAKSDQLAAFLCQEHPDKKPIFVYGDLRAEMLIVFLACTKSGHAYIPLDVHMPNDRLAMIVEDVDATAFFALCPLAEKVQVPVVYDTAILETLFAKQDPVQLEAAGFVQGDENYYLIFTSGTTGKPKGVQISHDNLVSYTDWMLTDFQLPEQSAFLCQAPFSFDLSVMDVYPALLSGGKLVPLEKEVVQNFQKLFQALPNLNLNVWVSTPSFAEICLMEPTFAASHLPDLTHMLFCGEELPHQTATALLERFPDLHLYNTYGPTEATVAVTQVQITPEILASVDRLPIGYVKEDTTLQIVDEEGKQLPDGEVGEIVIIGPSVSKGYLNEPEKTAAVFQTVDGQAAYHTGDAGSIVDGLLRYQGRLDFQVKLHGYRLELGDIEHHLQALDLVKQSLVVPKYKEHKVQQLVAFVVPNQHDYEKEFQVTKVIKQALQETLMDYMIPQKFIYRDQLPLTPNGKVDRKALIAEVNPT